MTKTAVIILNCNLPDYTDMLYESLKPYERNDYDLMVFDNGSTPEGMSKYTTYRSEVNGFFGGGFEAARQIVLTDERYDSLLFMNNDLTVHPYNFVRALRNEMFDPTGNIVFDVVSPCFYNVEANGQCHWKTVHCFGNESIRTVPYVDFQSPLISRRLLSEIGPIHPTLMMGFGIDFHLALFCKDRGYKLGVLDRMCILHHNSLTVKRGAAGINIQHYCQRAEAGQFDFFNNVIRRWDDYQQLREEARNYTFL